MPKFHLLTLVVKMLISGFSGLSLTLPLAFFPCYLHKEIALLLLHCESKNLDHFFTAYNFRNIEQIFTKFGTIQSLFILNIVPEVY